MLELLGFLLGFLLAAVVLTFIIMYRRTRFVRIFLSVCAIGIGLPVLFFVVAIAYDRYERQAAYQAAKKAGCIEMDDAMKAHKYKPPDPNEPPPKWEDLTPICPLP